MSKDKNATSTRRSLLVGGAAVAGSATLVGLTGVASPLRAATVSWTPEALTRDQAALLERLCDLLLPTTETPGALDAGVLQYIDRALSEAESDSAEAYRSGLAALDVYSRYSRGSAFIDLSTVDQDSVLIDVQIGAATGAGAVSS